MKNYRNAVAALVLALVLTTPAVAGIMYTDKAPPPPTPTTTSATQAGTTDGIMYTGAAESAPGATDSLTEIALSLLQNLLTLL